MEEMLLKGAELGTLAIVTLLLLTKGLSALNTLSASLNALAGTVDKLTDKINSMDSRVAKIERDLEAIKQQLLENNALVKTLFLKREEELP